MTTDSQDARVIRTVEHSHHANLERVEATKITASMKESASTRRSKPVICRPHSRCYRSYPSDALDTASDGSVSDMSHV